MDELRLKIEEFYKQNAEKPLRKDWGDYLARAIYQLLTGSVSNVEETKEKQMSPLWDTRNNPTMKKLLISMLGIQLEGVQKRDKERLQKYLESVRVGA